MLEPLADAAVQAPAARGREVGVGQLAEQVVHELDAAGVARLAEHAARQQQVDRVEHVGLAQIRQDVAQQVDVDHRPDDRRGAHHLLGLGRQALQSQPHHVAHRLGQVRRVGRLGRQDPAAFAAGDRVASRTSRGPSRRRRTDCRRKGRARAPTRSSASSSGRQLRRSAISSRVSVSVSGDESEVEELTLLAELGQQRLRADA